MEEQIYEASVEEKTLFSTEFEFTLPKGFIDEEGSVHRDGIMRLANARDEIAPLSDPKVRENKAYLVILILSRVITKLGNISEVTPEVVERFFSADLSYLQDFYRRINGDGEATIPATCPACGHGFNAEFKCLGK
ncbi:MAG: phage tail assembly protein [candidate division Zixibacteria bacterium]|jgi:hypothetical protein|nr:phage tail assembly protein [candidate division Zixibacteria bacterium]